MYQNLNELFQCVVYQPVKTLVIVCPYDENTLKASIEAYQNKLITLIFVGDCERIAFGLRSIDKDPLQYEIIHAASHVEAAQKSVDLIRNDKGDILMKGSISTSDFMKAVVDKQTGINTNKIISHLNILELKGYSKILAITDSAIMIQPTLEQKISIIQNAVQAMNKIGYQQPKVAALCAVEKVNHKMPETIEAQTLQELNDEGVIKDCIVEGPISFDIAVDQYRAELKNYEGMIKGDADILLAPNLVTGNILSKSLGIFGNSRSVGVVLGAKVPIVLTSRAANHHSKYDSIILAILFA